MAIRVLIVDDDVAFRATIGAVLTERGYVVVGEAGTVAQARTAIADLRPDAVLLDVKLPDGNGVALASELSATAGAPRMLLSSSDPAAVPHRVLAQSGATSFVAKHRLADTDLTPYLG